MSVYKENYQDLDIMSNFMINQLATDPELKEPFCRMLIRELLHREVRKIDIVAENAVDKATKEAHEYISQMKERNPEMSTVGDLIDNIVEQETKELKATIEEKDAEIARLKAISKQSKSDKDNENGLKALVNTLKPIFKTPEAVHENIISQEGFENTTIEDVKKYW